MGQGCCPPPFLAPHSPPHVCCALLILCTGSDRRTLIDNQCRGIHGMPPGPPRWNRCKLTRSQHTRACREIHGTPRPTRRAPWKWMSPRQRGRYGPNHNPTPPGRGPGLRPPPTHPACGSPQCRLRVPGGPHRREGAAYSRWCPTPARWMPTASGRAWLAGRYPHKGRGARNHAASRWLWRYRPWEKLPPPQRKLTRHWQGPSRRAWTLYTFWGRASPRCVGSQSRPPPRVPEH